MLIVVLAALAAMFVIYLIVKMKLGWKFCALCAAVSTTWIALLLLYWLGRFHNPVLLALLLGQSVTGFYYFVRRRVVETLRVFTLPFFLSLTAGAYFLVAGPKDMFPILILLLILWVAGYVVFSYRNDPGKKPSVNAVIDCCTEE